MQSKDLGWIPKSIIIISKDKTFLYKAPLKINGLLAFLINGNYLLLPQLIK